MSEKTDPRKPRSKVDRFFETLGSLTDSPTHERLIRAAKQGDPQVSVERELSKIIREILDED